MKWSEKCMTEFGKKCNTDYNFPPSAQYIVRAENVKSQLEVLNDLFIQSTNQIVVLLK